MGEKQEGLSLDDLPKWDTEFWIYFSTNTSLSAFEGLLKLYEDQWIKERIRIDKLVDEYQNKYQVGNTPNDFEQYQIYEIASRANFSIFLGAYSVLESFLLKMCDLIQTEFDFEVKLDDLNPRNHLNHYKTYLTKVYGLEKEEFEKHYPEVFKYSILRNVLTHSDGNSVKSKLEKIKGIKGIKIYSYSNRSQVVIDDISFFESFFNLSKLFLEDIHKAVEKRYVQLTT